MGMRLRRSLIESNDAAPTGVLDVGFRPLRTLLFLSLVVAHHGPSPSLISAFNADTTAKRSLALSASSWTWSTRC
jgi:hypothetical protein